jgi:DNA primase
MAEAPKNDDEKAEANSQDAVREAQQELRALLNRMHIDRLKALETEVIEAAKADPTQLARYKDVVERRKKLEASLVPNAS